MAKEISIYTQWEIEAPQRAIIEEQLETLHTIPEKIKYLKNEKAKYLATMSLRTYESSGTISLKFPQGWELFLDRWITQKIEQIKLADKINQEIFETGDPMDLIDIKYRAKFYEKEEKAKRLPGWNTLIGKAAFIELIFEHRYFKVKPGKKRNRDLPEKFALWKYDINIHNQLATAANSEREETKKRYCFLFKA